MKRGGRRLSFSVTAVIYYRGGSIGSTHPLYIQKPVSFHPLQEEEEKTTWAISPSVLSLKYLLLLSFLSLTKTTTTTTNGFGKSCVSRVTKRLCARRVASARETQVKRMSVPPKVPRPTNFLMDERELSISLRNQRPLISLGFLSFFLSCFLFLYPKPSVTVSVEKKKKKIK